MIKRQWADKYGSQWYKHYDGKPPHDEEEDYYWDGFYWVNMCYYPDYNEDEENY